MGRSPCCEETGVKKGPWTPEEDKKLIEYINNNGHGSWRRLPKLAGLNRCGKSCRLRWTNYLRPDIKRGRFDDDEEKLIIHLHSILGNKYFIHFSSSISYLIIHIHYIYNFDVIDLIYLYMYVDGRQLLPVCRVERIMRSRTIGILI